MFNRSQAGVLWKRGSGGLRGAQGGSGGLRGAQPPILNYKSFGGSVPCYRKFVRPEKFLLMHLRKEER